MRLTNWTATPSGGAIVINGTDQDGKLAKVQRVVARNAAGDYLATLA